MTAVRAQAAGGGGGGGGGKAGRRDGKQTARSSDCHPGPAAFVPHTKEEEGAVASKQHCCFWRVRETGAVGHWRSS